MRTGYLRRLAFACVVFVIATVAVCAQQQPQTAEPSFNVALHLIVGTNEAAGRNDVPAELGTVAKQMKASFGFSNYHLASTFFGRISNGGSFEYKSVSNILGQQSTADAQTFLEWSLGNFHTVPTANGGPGVQANAFRFGARVPVVVSGGKESSQIQYESIGVNVGRFVVAQNTPTLIGTLNLPGASGTIFLVMTVRSADQ